MNRNYKRTFDAVCMAPEKQEQIRAALSSRIAENQKEDNIVNIKSIKKSRKAVTAAAAILAVVLLGSVAYAAYGSQVIEHLTGQRVEYGMNSDGSVYFTSNGRQIADPAETRDGRIFFVLDGSDIDITDYCAEDAYYSYEYTADNGNRHVVLVGGTPGDISWIELIWDTNGNVIGNGSYYNNFTIPSWIELTQEAYGISLDGFEIEITVPD